MTIELSNPKPIHNGVMFNVIIGGIYILGFRILNGFILPPSTKSNKSFKYYPVTYLTKNLSERLYDAIIEKGWKVELRPKDEAINDLIISAGYFGVYYG